MIAPSCGAAWARRFARAWGSATAAQPDTGGRAWRFAKTVMSIWIKQLRELPENPDLARYLGLSPEVLRAVASGWAKSAHIHCVTIGLRDDQGRVTILSGPRSQIKDFIAGRNGLVGHAKLKGPWVPTAAQRAELEGNYEAWAPDLATGVWLGADRIPCYAWLERGAVRCDVRMLVTGLGGKVKWNDNTKTPHAFDRQGQEFPLLTGAIEVGYWRANVREVAEAMGYPVPLHPRSTRQATPSSMKLKRTG